MPQKLPLTEFVAGMAMLTATIAFTIDAMLPAMPAIGQDLSPLDQNNVQLIVTVFVFGVGMGTLIVGPISDAFGRRPVMAAFASLYVLGSLVAIVSQSLEVMLAARLLQGIGAAGPRICTLAIVRDEYAGRQMARIMSFIFIVFALVPAIAPSIGAGILALANWRAIFGSFIVFSVLSVGWLLLRQSETLPPEKRRPLRFGTLWSALVELLSNRTVRLAIIVQTLSYGSLFAVLSFSQQAFDITFGQGAYFHLWFALIAVIAASASFINARLVVRLGMRKMVRSVLVSQILFSGGYVALSYIGWTSEAVHFWVFFIWITSVFFMAGMTLGNLNAIAMEPMGHIAGMAASVSGALSTMGAALVAIPLARQFDGTPLPVALGICAAAVVAYGTMKVMGSRDEAPA